MIYTVNTLRSPALTLPTTLAINDEVVFNATGSRTQGVMIMWRVPVSGTYEVELWGANGSQGNIGQRDPPPNVGGQGGGVRGNLALASSESLVLVIGQVGVHLQPANPPYDGAAGGSGGGTFLFSQTTRGIFRIGAVNYRLLALAASGGGANDYGYRGTRDNGAHARNVIRDSNFATASTTIQPYCTALFAGSSYTRGESTSYGGFGGGGSSDDTQPNAVGYDIVSFAGSSYFHLAGTWLGLNEIVGTEGNGRAIFRLRTLKETGLYVTDDGLTARGAGKDLIVRTATQMATLKGVAGIS